MSTVIINGLAMLTWIALPLLLIWELARCLWLRVAPLTEGEELAPWACIWDALRDVSNAEAMVQAGLWTIGYPCLLLARLRFHSIWNRLERAGLVQLVPAEAPAAWYALSSRGLT